MMSPSHFFDTPYGGSAHGIGKGGLTDLGREMEGYYARGERLPDRTILPLLLPRLRRSMGFMLDNFPATVTQARTLDEDLSGRGAGGLSRVICLEGPTDEELLERILGGRRTSRATGRSTTS